MKNKNNFSPLKDWLITLLEIIIIISCSGIHVWHNHYVSHLQHIHKIKMIRFKERKKHYKLWHPVYLAKKHPTVNNLARLNIKHPYNNVALIVNHNHSNLLSNGWKKDCVHFSHKDKLGRLSSPATAYLDQENATGDALRKKQHVKPVGWHQHRYQGDWILNRGHLIAYSLSKDINFKGKHVIGRAVGNLNDRQNLFTETAFCNQQLQYAYETRVRIALEKGYHVIYRVQPIFYKNNLMPKGVHMQAISTNKKLDFNVYLFNVQPGLQFNYKDGFEVPNSNMNFNLPHKILRNSRNMDKNDKRMKLQRQIMKMYDTRQISYQQAYYDEQHVLGSYWISEEK